MPRIVVPIPWTEQPHGAEGVDWSNPLTQGLRDFSSLGSAQRRNVARNNFLSSNGAVKSDSRGPIITTDATAYSVPGGYSALPITVIVGFARLGTPTNGNHALWISKDDITGNGGLYFRYEDAGTLAVLKSQTAAIGSGAFTVKQDGSLLAVTIDSGNYTLYGDGGLVASGTHAQTFTSTTPVIGSESSEALEDHPNGIFYFHAVWGRVLSADEIKRISDNPWQLYQDEEFPVWFTAGGASGTMAAILGAFSANITGSTTIVGSITNTLDNNIGNLQGTAGSVSGSIAQTLENDTSNIAGTTSILGTISNVLNGDTSNIAGTTSIIGSITKTLENDVANFQGDAGSTSGVITATAQNDTASMAGQTTITGTLSASAEGATSNITGTTTILGQISSSISNFISSIFGTSGSPSLVARLLTLLGVGP